eukprot:Anaeramoba_ignava/a1362_7.p1 GENE.a1362_7~~a1362_7.p1  ORF type:complete len:152 (-),score=8.53 a1362_7:7-462(-)
MRAAAVWIQPATSKKERAYYLYIDGCQVPVSKEVYREYYRYRDQERYGERLSRRREASFQYLNKKHVPWEYQQYQEEQSIKRKNETTKLMMQAVEELNKKDRFLITALFIDGKTEEELAEELCVSQPAICKKRTRILKKLKKMIEIRASGL